MDFRQDFRLFGLGMVRSCRPSRKCTCLCVFCHASDASSMAEAGNSIRYR